MLLSASLRSVPCGSVVRCFGRVIRSMEQFCSAAYHAAQQALTARAAILSIGIHEALSVSAPARRRVYIAQPSEARLLARRRERVADA